MIKERDQKELEIELNKIGSRRPFASPGSYSSSQSRGPQRWAPVRGLALLLSPLILDHWGVQGEGLDHRGLSV